MKSSNAVAYAKGGERWSLEEAYPQRKYLEIEERSLRNDQAETNDIIFFLNSVSGSENIAHSLVSSCHSTLEQAMAFLCIQWRKDLFIRQIKKTCKKGNLNF